MEGGDMRDSERWRQNAWVSIKIREREELVWK